MSRHAWLSLRAATRAPSGERLGGRGLLISSLWPEQSRRYDGDDDRVGEVIAKLVAQPQEMAHVSLLGCLAELDLDSEDPLAALGKAYRMFAWITPGEVKVYELDQLEEAKNWVAA
jgi:hypothetical protein